MPTKRPLRLPLRFATVYLVLYNVSWPNGFPGSDWITQKATHLWMVVVHTFAELVLGVEVTRAEATGSSDTLFDYVRLLILFLLALLLTAVWSRVRRDDARDERLYRAALLFIRHLSAYFLLHYGIDKLLLMQMPPTFPANLFTRLADMSPMGLVWRFMGASSPYEIFCGAGETIAGVLLLWPRTATLGALAGAGVIVNVVGLNFCFDVCVKTFSVHLLLMLLFLAVPDLGRLADLLVFRRPTSPPPADPPPGGRSRLASRIARAAALVYLVGWCAIGGSVRRYHGTWRQGFRSEIYGMYDVETMLRDGKPVVPSVSGKDVWRHVGFDVYMSVWMLDESALYYMATYDAATHMLALARRNQPGSTLVVGRPDAEHLTLDGVLGSSLVSVRLKRVHMESFELSKRGFHWVNEQAHNL